MITKLARSIPWSRIWSLTALFVALAAAGHGPQAAGQGMAMATVMVMTNPTLNEPILTDSQGMTLYVYARDTNGVSNCTGNCASIWPPLQPGGTTPTLDPMAMGTLTVIMRSDGSQQLAYNGMPLYYYSRDQSPGDVNGQGVGGVWSVATP